MALSDLETRAAAPTAAALSGAAAGRGGSPTAVARRRAGRSIAFTIGRRVLGAVAVLWAATTAAFIALHAAPGDTAKVLLGTNAQSPDAIASVTAEWHLDDPLAKQYLDYLAGVLRGDLGTSYILHQPVTSVIFSQIGPTAELALGGAVVAFGLAVLLSVSTAGRKWPSRIANAIEMVIVSLPEFWLAIVLLVVFSFGLGWFPVAGANGFQSLVLPSLSLGLGIFGMLSQVLRESLERTLDEPYTLSVRSRGVSDLTLRLRHSLRHASIPVVTLTGYIVGGLLGGAVVVEQVFGRPGIGQITLSAVDSKDLPLVLGVALVGAFAYVFVNTIVDILALVIDPRLRYPSRSSR